MQVGVYDRDDQACQYEGCTEMDLLPARCSNCHKRFCSHHLAYGAHQCTAVTDVRVGTCPLCNRVVPLEYPRQNVDEAVSRHMDRGCRDVPQGQSRNGDNGVLSSFFGGSGARAGGGRRLGGSVRPCSHTGCHETSETRVTCDQCKRVFCLQHRGPLQHDCRAAAAARSSASASPAPAASSAAAPGSPLGNTAASVARLLAHPSNTPDKAVGKATELPSDMVTCLVCFLIPTSPSIGAGGDAFAPVPSFFMYMPKSTALGRLLDTAVDKAAMSSPAVRTGAAWKLYAVTLPIHTEAEASYYPPLPLSTVVGKSAVGRAERAVLFLTPLPSLPSCVIEAVRDVERKGTLKTSKSSSGGDGCHLM